MKKTLFEISKSIFDNVVGISSEDIEFNVTNEIEYAKIEYANRISVTIPSPLTLHNQYFIEGNVFSDSQEYANSIWSLYLSTVYHVGAHVRLSNYTEYDNWSEGKMFEKCWNVISFIEDIKVEGFLKKNHPQIWQHMTMIKMLYDTYYDNQIRKDSKFSREIFSKFSGIENTKKVWREKVSKTLLEMPNHTVDKIIPFLDLLYKNQHLLPKNNYPYCDRPHYKKYQKGIPNIVIPPKAEFENTINDLNECWIKETFLEAQQLERYQKYGANSNFDKIEINPENFGEFMRITNANASDLKRLRNTLRTLSFYVDSPAFEEIGLIELPSAIQRVGSQCEEIECFEQDIPKKESENWVVVFDNSSSMKLRFEEMKKFIICLGETAEEINRDGGKWGLYSFNNKFLIVKDHRENYNQKVKARIGGLKSSGLSFISDAVDMGVKILNHDNKSVNKYLIIVSDGKSLGSDEADNEFLKSLERARKHRINLIGIGTPKNIQKPFAFTIDYTNTKKSVKKFIDSYSMLVQSQ
ncbi:MAG: VWA domain-containing protein [Nitrosopumilus sp.]|nr:VWA domain-containing protein [Nitrosopumilus sp.]